MLIFSLFPYRLDLLFDTISLISKSNLQVSPGDTQQRVFLPSYPLSLSVYHYEHKHGLFRLLLSFIPYLRYVQKKESLRLAQQILLLFI